MHRHSMNPYRRKRGSDDYLEFEEYEEDDNDPMDQISAYELNPWHARCGRVRGSGYRLHAADEHALPDAAFGLIRWRKARRGGTTRPGYPGLWHRSRHYPMPDAVHAANAKSRATREMRSGRLGFGDYTKVMRKADAILSRCGGILAPGVRHVRPGRYAANPARTGRLRNHSSGTLSERYGGWWGEHPDYPVEDWQYMVANGDTRQGYWEWVEASEADR